RYESIHHRRDRVAWDQAVARSHGGLRHAVDDWDLVPIYRISTQARTGARDPDRTGPDADRAAVSGRSRTRRRRQANAAAVAPAVEAKQIPEVSRTGAGGDARLVGVDGRVRYAHRQAHEAAGRGLGTGPATG